MISYNINHYVAVQLTDFGEKILELNHERLNELLVTTGAEPKPFQLELNADGLFVTQLWSLMNMFGNFMAIGKDLPFDGEIFLIGDTP